jgi:hypothetical protein
LTAYIDKIDEIFNTFAEQQIAEGPTIACLYTGQSHPSSCGPMPLSPMPPLGAYLDKSFSRHFVAALALNSAAHDGAIMFGRIRDGERYILTGWSFRLFPQDSVVTHVANRGSAFNSCLAMSVVTRVDRLYVISRDAKLRFERGEAKYF